METFKDFEKFNYFGVYVDCYFDNNQKLYKKRVLMPKSYKLDMDNNEWKNNLNNVWDKNRQMMVKPNGIAIMTKMSNLTIVDIDEPKKCKILDKLLNDCKFIVKTHKGFHLYFNRCNAILNQTLLKILDVNTNLIYYIPKYYEYNVNNIINGEYINKDGKKCYFDKYEDYKLNKNVEFNYELIKNEGLCDLPEYAINYIDILISLKEDTTTITNPNIKKLKPEYIIKPDYEIEKFNIKTMNIIYKVLFDNDYFNEYKLWLKTAYMCRNVNNTDESFKLFHHYSTMIEKYNKNTVAHNAQYFYRKNEYDINFDENALLYLVKRLNGKIYKEHLEKLLLNNQYDAFIEKFERKYIYPHKNDEDYETHITKFNDFIEKDEFKFMLLKSAYGTGKTYYFKTLLNETINETNKNFDIDYLNPINKIQELTQPKYKKVVFITYRQSLAHTLYNELHDKYNFQHYQELEGNIKEKRLIIQIDSIMRIDFNNFDLIVLDEIEGLLNHLSSPLIKNQYYIYGKLKNMIVESPKILCMDGDLGERSCDFINNMKFKCNYKNYKLSNGKMVKIDDTINDVYFKIYQNTYKTQSKHFIFMNGDAPFYDNINKDLNENKKIVIVSMSANVCEIIEKMYSNKYKVIKHTGIDKNKDILKEFKSEWKKCDILVYSPTIEAGVDFDEEYFDKCYGVICNKSTCPRAYNQMLNRIRNFKEHTINILMLNIPNFITNGLVYRKEEIENIKFSDYQDTDETFLNIIIHNETEAINAISYLITEFTKQIKSKGHTYEYISGTKNEQKGKEEKPKAIKVNKILNSKSIDEEEFKKLETKQKRNIDITPNNFYSIQKFLYTKYFNVSYNELTYDFIYNRLDKFNIVGNNKRFISYCNENNKIIDDTIEMFKNDLYNKCLIYESPKELLENTEKYIDIINTDIKKFNINLELDNKKKQKIIYNIIDNLGYNIIENKLIKVNENYDIEKIEKLLNTRDFKILFKQSRQIKTLNTMKCLNELLEEYGIKMNKKRVHSHYEEKEGERKQIYKYEIKGEYLPYIDELIKNDEKKKE
jgi:hypothetical protein